MKQFSLLTVTLLLTLCAHAQVKLDFDQWKNFSFRNIGPAGMSGRVTAIDVDLSDEHRIFLGSASGGVWLSENGGTSFKNIFDDQPSLAIGAIKINQRNPDEIWVGTGEGNPRNSLNTGNGIYKSNDGGKTWKLMGLEKTKTIHRIIIDRDNSDIVYAAALGSPWGSNEDRGVFKTIDGGKTWKKILYVNALTGAADMVVDPTNPRKLIVAMWEHQRQPWFFNSGGKGSGIYITYDGGENWNKIKQEDGLPKGNLGRVGLAIAASKPNVVYALIEAGENGLYKSEDGGVKWKLLQSKDIGNRPFYYSEIYVDPKNENRLYNVYTYLSKSEDGGMSFKSIADYGNAVHPDHHALWIHPHDPAFIIDGNDGGAAISRDQGNTWTFVSNLPVGQFYHINVDNDVPYNVYGGMQDNGSWVGPSSVLKAGGIRNTDFQELYFGDGFDVVPRLDDSRYGYAMSQGGSLAYYDRLTGHTKYIKPTHPTGQTLRYNWNSAIARDPFNTCGVYYGSQHVHYSIDCGDNWKIISPDLTTNDTSKLHQKLTGGLTLDATGAENHCTIIAITPSPLDSKIIWIGTDDGNVQVTRDGGGSWENVSKNIPGLPKGCWIPQIQVNKFNAGEAFVVANDYRRNDYTAYAYHTIDYGKTWKRIADGSQVPHFAICIVQDNLQANLLFLGTDGGLYVSFDKGNHWQHWEKTLPNVQIADMVIQERENDLVIATFGRSIWILDDISPLRAIAQNADVLKQDWFLMGGGQAYNMQYRSYEGVRFYAQGDFTGTNDNMGRSASVYLWSKKVDKKQSDDKDEKKTTPEPKESKLKWYILNEQGDTIRRRSVKLESGLQKINWGFEMDGVRGPRQRDVEKDDDPSSGYDVLPGKYKFLASYQGKKDSTYITVLGDPRINTTADQLKKKQIAIDEYNVLQKQLATNYEFIKDCKKSMKAIEALLPFQQDSLKKKIENWQKPVKQKLDSLDQLYFLPDNTKGIVYDEDRLLSITGEASYYLDTSIQGWTDNSTNSFSNARRKADQVFGAIDAFRKKQWADFVKNIEESEMGIFKKTE